ncbi:hypothetical protein M0R45_034813 [Rubus argutus]|uniref:Ion transport domain-containing protein n=1 Tax=Rubus argutus TaxID=59490 RepID=A0AAW1VSC0_RUBAR
MSNPAENVIDMRSLDGNLSGESEKKDGVLLTATSARLLEETLNAHHRIKRMWNTFFVLACCFAVFIDPLFCYIEVIDEDKNGIHEDKNLMVAYLFLRLIADVVYMIDTIISSLGIIFKKREKIAKPFRACWRTISGDQTIVVHPRSPPAKENQSISARIHKLLPLLPRILVVLPILEIVIISWYLDNKGDNDWDIDDAFYITIPIQYTLRIYDIYASLKKRLVMNTGIQRCLKPILDFLPFILASHLFAALCSYGSNLNTSSLPSEIYFSVLYLQVGWHYF